jgi:TolA-binding protein
MIQPKKHLSLAFVFLWGALALAAEAPSAGDSLKTWFQNLKQGLSDSAVGGHFQKGRGIAAVAAVRGDRQTLLDPNKPHWKLKSAAERKADKAERQEFSSAVDAIVAGKIAEGSAALDAFIKAHPKSPYLKEAQKAREKASELEKAAPAAEPQVKP